MKQDISPCIGKDELCPCQDGDICHYKGEHAWPIPERAETMEEYIARRTSIDEEQHTNLHRKDLKAMRYLLADRDRLETIVHWPLALNDAAQMTSSVSERQRHCSTCGGPTIRQNVISNSQRHYHRHLTDCIAFLKSLRSSLPSSAGDPKEAA